MTPVTATMTTATARSAAAAPAAPTILKTDALGRVRLPAARREALLDEFEASSATAPAFARLAGVNYQTFATWVQQRRRRRRARAAATEPVPVAEPAATAVRWLEAVVEADAHPGARATEGAAAALRLHLPGGVTLEIGVAAQVPLAAALLRTLGQAGR